MDIRDEENDFRDKNLSFKYKSLTEEEKFIDNVILENNSSKENNTKELTFIALFSIATNGKEVL